MLIIEKKDKAIKYYLQGMTMTAIAAEIGVTRQKVSKYIKAYETIQKQIQLTQNTLEKEQLIMQVSSKPKYDTSSRKRLTENQTKLQRGQRKMMMKNIDIHEWLMNANIKVVWSVCCILQSFFVKSSVYISQSHKCLFFSLDKNSNHYQKEKINISTASVRC